MKSKIFLETLVGALVLSFAVGFVVLLNSGGRGVFDIVRNDYEIFANFQSVDNLVVGSDVRLSGVKVGTVDDIVLDKKTFFPRVKMRLDKSFGIPDDSSAQIVSSALISGDSYITLEPGSSETFIEPEGEVVYTQGSVSFLSILSQMLSSK